MPCVNSAGQTSRRAPFDAKNLLLYFAAAAAGLFGIFYGFNASGYKLALNKSESINTALYWVTPYKSGVERGSYVYFKIPPNPYFDGELVKRVAGIEGDLISVSNGIVYVNGVQVGPAKPKTRKGYPLTPASRRFIPKGFVFVAGDHIDSFDSRYEEFGLVPLSRLQGYAEGLF